MRELLLFLSDTTAKDFIGEMEQEANQAVGERKRGLGKACDDVSSSSPFPGN